MCAVVIAVNIQNIKTVQTLKGFIILLSTVRERGYVFVLCLFEVITHHPIVNEKSSMLRSYNILDGSKSKSIKKSLFSLLSSKFTFQLICRYLFMINDIAKGYFYFRSVLV